ncbi:MAG: hypothetical protein EPN94_06930 [Nitrospirae bacterium]|nr:MAG: hypothetical protein EPN94_06930 [Nitrospirota bacterium]
MKRVIIICAVLVFMIAAMNAFSGSGDVVKERFQESDIQALKEQVNKLERKVSRLEKIIIQNNLEKRVFDLEKKQMEKDMNEGLKAPK